MEAESRLRFWKDVGIERERSSGPGKDCGGGYGFLKFP